MEEMQNRGHALLKGAIAKKKRKNSANYCSAAEQVVIRRNKIQPLIIHTVSPPLFHAEPSTFMRIVQSLTGCPATRLRCEDEAAAAVSAAGSPMMFSDAPTAVGSPCSSMSSTITTTATSADEGNLDTNVGPNGSCQVRIWEYEVNVECRDIQEPMSSPSMSSCSLLLDSSQHDAFFVDSGASPSTHIEEHLYFADSSGNVVLPSAHYHQHSQDLESTLDSYLEHLLSSYDRDAYCKFTSTSALLADVCDPLLLKELS